MFSYAEAPVVGSIESSVRTMRWTLSIERFGVACVGVGAKQQKITQALYLVAYGDQVADQGGTASHGFTSMSFATRLALSLHLLDACSDPTQTARPLSGSNPPTPQQPTRCLARSQRLYLAAETRSASSRNSRINKLETRLANSKAGSLASNNPSHSRQRVEGSLANSQPLGRVCLVNLNNNSNSRGLVDCLGRHRRSSQQQDPVCLANPSSQRRVASLVSLNSSQLRLEDSLVSLNSQRRVEDSSDNRSSREDSSVNHNSNRRREAACLGNRKLNNSQPRAEDSLASRKPSNPRPVDCLAVALDCLARLKTLQRLEEGCLAINNRRRLVDSLAVAVSVQNPQDRLYSAVDSSSSSNQCSVVPPRTRYSAPNLHNLNCMTRSKS